MRPLTPSGVLKLYPAGAKPGDPTEIDAKIAVNGEFPACGLARCGHDVWFRFVPIQSYNENHRRCDNDQKSRSHRTQPNQNVALTLSHTYLSLLRRRSLHPSVPDRRLASA